jgi:hypothetical protein
MTDLVKIALIAAAPGIVASILGFINRKKLDTVQQTADDNHQTGKEIKTLVDGTLAIQYQVNATSARALAIATKLPEHVILADAADLKLKDHLATLAAMGLRAKGEKNGS